MRCMTMLIVLRKTMTSYVLLSGDIISTCLNVLGRNVIFYLEMQFIQCSKLPILVIKVKKFVQYLQCLEIQNIC